MEELIKEAERLYKQMDEIQLDLVKSRLDVCEEQKWKAISEMETAMCNAFQFLKCIIERKDNIVDLGEVWHEISEPFRKSDMIIYGNNRMQYLHFADEGECLNDERNRNYKYAYVDDLMPKGGEAWNTTK